MDNQQAHRICFMLLGLLNDAEQLVKRLRDRGVTASLEAEMRLKRLRAEVANLDLEITDELNGDG